jgi:3-ketoacyl-CoA synthase
MAVAGDALKTNIISTAPLVLPASELLKFFIFSMEKKGALLEEDRTIRPQLPDCI